MRAVTAVLVLSHVSRDRTCHRFRARDAVRTVAVPDTRTIPMYGAHGPQEILCAQFRTRPGCP